MDQEAFVGALVVLLTAAVSACGARSNLGSDALRGSRQGPPAGQSADDGGGFVPEPEPSDGGGLDADDGDAARSDGDAGDPLAECPEGSRAFFVNVSGSGGLFEQGSRHYTGLWQTSASPTIMIGVTTDPGPGDGTIDILPANGGVPAVGVYPAGEPGSDPGFELFVDAEGCSIESGIVRIHQLSRTPVSSGGPTLSSAVLSFDVTCSGTIGTPPQPQRLSGCVRYFE